MRCHVSQTPNARNVLFRYNSEVDVLGQEAHDGQRLHAGSDPAGDGKRPLRPGGPFAAVVVKDGRIIAAGANSVTSTNDPTAHAEVNAIREACRALGAFQLTGCEIYTSCEPCPMCLGAIYWARPDRVYYAATAGDAAAAGFDDSFIYEELKLAHCRAADPSRADDARSGARTVPRMESKGRPHPILSLRARFMS